MSKAPDLRLWYQVMRCDRCSGQRIRGQSCPECGKRPDSREVDDHTARRRRLLAGFSNPVEAPSIALEAASGTPQEYRDIEELADACLAAISYLFDAAKSLNDAQSDGQTFHTAFTNYGSLLAVLIGDVD